MEHNDLQSFVEANLFIDKSVQEVIIEAKSYNNYSCVEIISHAKNGMTNGFRVHEFLGLINTKVCTLRDAPWPILLIGVSNANSSSSSTSTSTLPLIAFPFNLSTSCEILILVTCLLHVPCVVSSSSSFYFASTSAFPLDFSNSDCPT
ncbi:hypothetical protein GOP47_0027149 [Adiantum capillus-veneris]|nr:hypothetical protein GOP47_0027149 [Adiantum capillus-veneris]